MKTPPPTIVMVDPALAPPPQEVCTMLLAGDDPCSRHQLQRVINPPLDLTDTVLSFPKRWQLAAIVAGR